MKNWMKVTCVAAVACGACAQPNTDDTTGVAPGASVTVTGQALLENQQPLTGMQLEVDRAKGWDCDFQGLFTNEIQFKRLDLDSNGHFNQTWTGAETQDDSGTPRCLSLKVPGHSSSDYMTVQFHVQSEQIQLPTLQQWSGTPSATASSEGVTVSFKDVSATQPDAGATTALVHVEGPSGDIWVTSATPGSSTLLSQDVLEDKYGFDAYVTASRDVTVGTTAFEVFQRSEDVDVPESHHLPLSRGAGCTYPGAPTDCKLTDGTLDQTVSFNAGTRQVVLQLSQAQVLRKAILRNLDVTSTPQTLILEGSTDGATWVPLANLLEGSAQVRAFIEVPLGASTPVSQVRLSLGDSGSSALRGLSELSLF